LIENARVSILFLNKALFYVDFYHFKRHNRSITGARYVPLDYGPCPDQYQTIFEHLVAKGSIEPKEKHKFEVKEKPDLSLFDDYEKETIQFICKLCKKNGGKDLLKVSHQEKGFKETAACRFISYEYAKDLKIG